MSKRRLSPSVRVLEFAAAGLIGFAVVATAMTLSALRRDAIKAAQRDTNNIALILANQISRSVREIDAILNEFSDRAANAALITPAQFRQAFGAPELFDVMRVRLAEVPQADIITVVDSSGRALNSTMRAVKRGMDFSDRDYFKYLSTHASADMYVSVPVAGRVTGERKIFFSRRISGGFGDFIGLVTIGVPVSYFQRSYESIGSLAGQSLLLLRRDGTILLRYPNNNPPHANALRRGSEWYDVVARGGGFYRTPGHLDGNGPRLVAAQPLSNYPLVANVSMLESAALATWKERAALIGFGMMIAASCSIMLLRALAGQFRRLTESQASLTESNLRLDAAMNNMSHGLAMFDKDQRLMIVNRRFAEMYGLPEDAIAPGCTLVDVLNARAAMGTFLDDPIQFAAALKSQIANGKPNYLYNEIPDGRTIAIANFPIPNGGWVTTHEDVTERRRDEARIAHMAHFDALTDLPNRALIRETMEAALAHLHRTGECFTVFIFDLDLFKAVNDSLGHPIGDALLKAIADRLRSCARDGCAIGRLGGDEFAIIQAPKRNQDQEAVSLAEMLLRTISAPYEIEGHPIVIGISIGIALAPKDGNDATELLKNADLALYRAKSEGRKDFRFFEPEMDHDAKVRHELEIDLRTALARNEFEIHYQPILDIVSRRPCGAEALVRWRHPERGLIGPDRFIPVAEDIGFIMPLGKWILRQACAEAAKWPASIKLAVNLSPVQFRSPGLVEVVSEALAESGLPPERLELEITESVLLQKDDDNIESLRRLSELGVGIVLDDFGTGYSSLSYLRLHKFSKIKIDKSFVAELPHQPDCAAIVCAVTGLARSLGIGTTAEGVETAEQFELLRAAGCNQAQGFLFSRPKPADKLTFDVGGGQEIIGAA